MRRSDRLFDLIQILRDGRLHRAQDMADKLEVSIRTIYREALHLGMAVVGEAADEELRGAARSLSAKIDAVLPEDRSAPPTGWGFAVYPYADAANGFQHKPGLRGAIRARQKMEIDYISIEGEHTTRVIRPLQLEYWGRIWTVTSWCELREAFRVFRVDEIEKQKILPATFVEEPGKTLQDYLETVDADR